VGNPRLGVLGTRRGPGNPACVLPPCAGGVPPKTRKGRYLGGKGRGQGFNLYIDQGNFFGGGGGGKKGQEKKGKQKKNRGRLGVYFGYPQVEVGVASA